MAALLLAVGVEDARAERQIKPLLGFSFGGGTTFIDVEDASGGPNVVVGGSNVYLGDLFGVDVDFGYGPGFFEAGDRALVVSSSVTTLTGNVVVALPRRLAEVGLRPYVVGGAGLMHVRISQSLDVLRVVDTLPAINVGAGVTGFLTDRLGLSWEARYFRSIAGGTGSGVSFGRERLSFWRGSMALAIRY